MANKINITSVEAIEAFRAHLILYISKASPALDEVSSELGRTKNWVQNTQKGYWMGVLKQRGRALEEAQANMFSAKLSNFREAASAEQLALTKAKNAYAEAEHKMRVIRRWDREFEERTEPLAKQLEKFHTILADDLSKAVHRLAEIIKILDEYTALHAPSLTENTEPANAAPDETGEPSTTTPPTSEGGSKGGAA